MYYGRRIGFYSHRVFHSVVFVFNVRPYAMRRYYVVEVYVRRCLIESKTEEKIYKMVNTLRAEHWTLLIRRKMVVSSLLFRLGNSAMGFACVVPGRSGKMRKLKFAFCLSPIYVFFKKDFPEGKTTTMKKTHIPHVNRWARLENAIGIAIFLSYLPFAFRTNEVYAFSTFWMRTWDERNNRQTENENVRTNSNVSHFIS